MLFNSFEFPVFFAVCFLLYWTARKRIRTQNAILLIASYFFYGWWDTRFLCLITLSTAIDYSCAIGINKGEIPKRQRLLASIYLPLTAFAFLGLDWEHLLLFPLLGDVSQIYAPTQENLWLIIGTVAISAFGNVLYPILLKLGIEKRRKAYAFVSIASNLAILAVFKYFNFFAESLEDISALFFDSGLSWTTVNIILPVGISFYTFQTMSYTIDVYREKLKPCDSFLELAAYVSFFPQLVAGPIERAAHLIPQFQYRRKLNQNEIKEGIWLIFWGFYKKLVVADNLAKLVNTSFEIGESAEGDISGGRMLVAIYAFAFQIYCDFSGYTDIARGTAKLLGFDLMLNFNVPYVSRSPSEFWQRWHISLSSWLRDYLYIPLGGNRGGEFRTYRNLMLTMALGGLWHGASWNFVAWGIYQGAILIIYRIVCPGIDKRDYSFAKRFLQWAIMFQLTCFGWLLFRITNLSNLTEILTNIVTNFEITKGTVNDTKDLIFYTIPLILVQFVQIYKNNLLAVLTLPKPVRFSIYLFVLYSLLMLSSQGGSDFIYFAF